LEEGGLPIPPRRLAGTGPHQSEGKKGLVITKTNKRVVIFGSRNFVGGGKKQKGDVQLSFKFTTRVVHNARKEKEAESRERVAGKRVHPKEKYKKNLTTTTRERSAGIGERVREKSPPVRSWKVEKKLRKRERGQRICNSVELRTPERQ